jgi:Trypsin-like peptidase domain
LSEDGEYTVTVSGGDPWPAKLVGRDTTTDVALLRVDRSDLRPLPLEAAPVSVDALAIAMGAEDDAPPRCEQRRRQGDAVPRRTLRIAAEWFPPPAMKLTTR